MLLKKRNTKIVTIIICAIFLALCIFTVNNYRGIINIANEKIALMQGCMPVLAFHGFVPQEIKESNPSFSDNQWIDDIEGFEEQMKYLYENGWHTLTADEFYAWHQDKLEIPEKTCVLTFDDGYYEMYYPVYPILKKYNMNAIAFVIGSYTPETTAPYDPAQRNQIGWDKIKEIKENYPGLSFESHSYNLHGFDEDGNETWIAATLAELREDFKANAQYGFRYMAYPYGGYNKTMLKAIGESNIKMAFTYKNRGYATKSCNVYKIPRQKITAITTFDEFVEVLEKTL